MTNNDEDYERAKLLAYDDVNVTEGSPLISLFQMLIKLLLILAITYIAIFTTITIGIKTLSINNQIKLEKFLSSGINFQTIKISQQDNNRLNKVKNEILQIDTNFPKTSGLNIKIINEKYMNAFCAPDGNIYITKPLYERLDNDGELMFVLAHEMAHYKKKDHIMKIRTGLTNGSILILISVISSNNENLYNILKDIENLSDFKYSRTLESQCDIYAGKILKKKYGTTVYGIQALELLKGDINIPGFDIYSTHPNLNKRIRELQKL